jgi:hypothetical protein
LEEANQLVSEQISEKENEIEKMIVKINSFVDEHNYPLLFN